MGIERSDIEAEYEEMGYEQDGTLTTRFFGSYYWNDASIDPVPIAKQLMDQNQTGLVQFSALKVNMDGDHDKWNGLYVDGFDDKPDADPKPIIPFDVIDDAVARADAEHLHVICHCFGDLAVREFLDAVELARNDGQDVGRGDRGRSSAGSSATSPVCFAQSKIAPGGHP